MEKCVKAIINQARKDTQCAIQYKNCPCGTCFKNWAVVHLKLNGNLAHALWNIVLQHRGDYAKEEIDAHNEQETKTRYTKEDLQVDADWLIGEGVSEQIAESFLRGVVRNCGGTIK